jgi:lysozyme family protein
MPTKFEIVYKLTRVSEGGNVDDPHDHGGRTSRGILNSEYNEYLARKGKPPGDVWEATEEEIWAIYYENYWLKTEAEKFPLYLAYMLFDFGVHSGVNTARVAAQRTVGVTPDNIFGPITRAALRAAPPQDFITYYTRRRWEYVKTRPSFAYFSAGWAKRISDCKQNALKLLKTEQAK